MILSEEIADEIASLISTLSQHNLKEHISRVLTEVCSPHRNKNSLTKLCFQDSDKIFCLNPKEQKKKKILEVIMGHTKVYPVILKRSKYVPFSVLQDYVTL